MTSLFETCIPHKILLHLASLIERMRDYATIKKRKGERRNRCLNPLKYLKNQEGGPLIRTANESLFKKPMIQFTVFIFIPICKSIRKINI
jgi:hypothetical protein